MKVGVLSTVAWRTPPQHYGPWEQVASNLTEGLVELGCDVTLFATKDSISNAKLNAIIQQGYESDKTQDPKVVECLHIANAMEHAGEFDIIHNHFDFLPLTYSRLINVPMLTTIHGFSSEKIVEVYRMYNDNNFYASISNSDRHEDLKYIGTVYNGLNLDEFDYSAITNDYLVFLGRIHPDKGTAEAIQIALNSKKKLIIAGIIQDSKYFEECVQPFLGEQIEFIGHVNPHERNLLLGKALALLHPINFNEPFGLSVVEAMLCGTPVIAFNRGSMPELIEDKKSGFLVTTVDEAVETVSSLSYIDRHYCSEYARKRFSAKSMAEEYYRLYCQILGR